MADEAGGDRAGAKEPRNEQFGSDRPFQGNNSLKLLGATGSLRCFNATSAQYGWDGWSDSQDRPPSAHAAHGTETEGYAQHPTSEESGEPEGHLPASRKDDVISFLWRSRDNRKGRHALVLRGSEGGAKQPHGTLEPTNTLTATLHGVGAMFTFFPYWDISWWVAVVFVLGSMVWVANGFIVLLPAIGAGSSADYASAWTGFAGAGIFFVGSVLLFLEAINTNRDGCFGWAVEQTMKGGRREAEVHPGHCDHHHYHDPEKNTHKEHSVHDYHAGREGDFSGSREHLLSHSTGESHDTRQHHWIWWPSWREVRSQLIHEIGFLACGIQLLSATLFWISKVPAIPSVSQRLPQTVIDGTQWLPQFVGCLGFIGACILFMLETQPYWYIPAPGVLGWHVGFWKLIGCVGFTLSTVFGACGQHGIEPGQQDSSISCFWASWAILLGSLVQWYESLDKHPIVEEGTSRYSEWNEKYIKKSEERRNAQDEETQLNTEDSRRQRRYGTLHGQ